MTTDPITLFKICQRHRQTHPEEEVNDEPLHPSYHFNRIMTLRQEKLREREQLKRASTVTVGFQGCI